jgi:3-hydroxyisobutyrate dehydrogenase
MKVGFIGLGTMGASMALNCRTKGGYDMIVNDLRRDAAGPHLEHGAKWANSAREVGEASDVVLTSLPGPKEVQAVGEELIAVMKKGSVWFDLSTNSPTVVRKLAERFAAKGIALLDAPVSGGPVGAKSGQLALYVGGDKAAYDKHKAVLDSIGDQAMYIGPSGAGTVAKLVHNCMGYAILAVEAEVFSMGVKAGVEPLALWSAIRQGAFGRKRTFDRLGEQFLMQKWDPPSFALELAHKDVTLATEVGREFHVPMKLANTVLQEMTEAMNHEGWPKRDSRIFMQLQTQRAGVNIKLPEQQVQEVLKRN